MFKSKKERIYKHTFLDQRVADRLIPLMESTFAPQMGQYSGNRAGIKEEKKRFMSEQYANRCRIASNMGVSPLFEDSKIFNQPNMVKLFENFSEPGNVIGMGEVVNADSSNQHAGGTWNPAYKAGSGDIPSYVFGLQSHIAMHCVGFDLMPTIAVDTPKVMISYVDTVYGGGVFDDAVNPPSFVELSSDIFTHSFVKTKKLKRATSIVYIIGETVTTDATKESRKCIKARFMIASTVKAALTVEVLETGLYETVIADKTATFTESTEYSVKDVIDSINKNTGKYFIDTLASGILTSTEDIINSISVNYASATRTTIAEASSNNNSLGGMTRAQHEKGPKHKLNVIAMDKQLEMLGIEIDADTSNIQIKDMAAMGINVIAMLYSGVQNELVQALDEVILDHLYAMGTQHAINAVQSQGINHSIYIDNPSKTNIKVSDIDVKMVDMLGNDVRESLGVIKNQIQSSGYENQMTHADRLYSRILRVAEYMGQQNRIGTPDFIVLPGDLAACLKKNSTFTTCPTPNTLASNPELSYSGTIFDTINVYKNPRISFTDPRILLGRRGNDTDPGSKFLAYDLASSRQIIAEGTMAEKIRVWSRFAIADIGFYPELNYYVMLAINGYDWC